MMTIVSHDSRQITINEVIINDRTGDGNCDFTKSNPLPIYHPIMYSYTSLPTSLGLGDTAEVDTPCGHFVKVVIKTDQGDATFDIQ